MSDSLRAYERLKGSLEAMLMTGLQPMLWVVSKVSSALASMVGIMAKIPGVATVLSFAMGTVLVVAVVRAVSTIRQLISAIMALGMAARTASGQVNIATGRSLASRMVSRAYSLTAARAAARGSGGIISRLAGSAASISMLGRLVARAALAVLTPVALSTWIIGGIGVILAAILGYVVNRYHEIIGDALFGSRYQRWDVGLERQFSAREKFDLARRKAILSGSLPEIEKVYANRKLLLESGIIKRTSDEFSSYDTKVSEARAVSMHLKDVKSAMERQGTLAQLAQDDRDAKVLADNAVAMSNMVEILKKQTDMMGDELKVMRQEQFRQQALEDQQALERSEKVERWREQSEPKF